MGPAVATKILLGSGLNEHYKLLHVNTNVHESLQTLGTLGLRKIPQNLGIYLRLFTVLLRDKPDLVVIPISQSTIGFVKDAGFILMSTFMGRKTLIQLRGSNLRNWLAKSSWLANRFVAFTLKTADGVIVLGDKLRYLFEDYFPGDKIFVSPNGANYPLLTQAPVETNDTVHILYLANLRRAKGIVDLIKAIYLLREKGAGGFKLHVVGEWVDEEARRACEALVLEGRLPVEFHGPATGRDKFNFLTKADIFAFVPREPEGHPWVIVEACAAGLPIISTDQGAITESVHENVNGFIVASNSPEQIASKLHLLIDSAEERARLGKGSREIYQQHFTENHMVERLRKIFDSCLS